VKHAPTVAVHVLVAASGAVFFLPLEAGVVAPEDPLVARRGQDHHLVLGIGADGAERLADGAVQLPAPVRLLAERMHAEQDHAAAPLHREMLVELLAVFVEARVLDVAGERHTQFLRSGYGTIKRAT
jgi:hypothetical protein